MNIKWINKWIYIYTHWKKAEKELPSRKLLFTNILGGWRRKINKAFQTLAHGNEFPPFFRAANAFCLCSFCQIRWARIFCRGVRINKQQHLSLKHLISLLMFSHSWCPFTPMGRKQYHNCSWKSSRETFIKLPDMKMNLGSLGVSLNPGCSDDDGDDDNL